MTLPFEFEEPEPAEGSHLVASRCATCPATVWVVPGHSRDARCIECGRASQGIDWAASVMIGEWHLTIGYPQTFGSRVAERVLERSMHPAPLSAGAWEIWTLQGDGPVDDLALFGLSAGWNVRVRHAEGYGIHGTTGRPTKLVKSVALAFDRPGYAARVVRVEGSWRSMWLLPALSRAPLLADLREWLGACGDVGEEWYATIRERVEEARVAGVEQDGARKFLKGCGLSEAEIRNQFGLELDDLAFLVVKSKKKEGAS